MDIKKTKIDELFHRFLNHPGVFEKLQEAHSLALRGVNPLGERQTKKERSKKGRERMKEKEALFTLHREWQRSKHRED